jgi:hygromycin-B 4-O-kinase
MVDLDAAADFLRARYGHPVADVTHVGQGEWSVAYAFRLDGDDLVVRFGPQADDFQKDASCAGFATAALPIPAVLEVGEALGGYHAISRRVFGGFIDDLDASGFRAALPSLFATFDAARAADLSATRGFGMFGASGNAPYPTWRDALLAAPVLSERMPDWRERLAASAGGTAAFDRGMAALGALVEFCPEERHLLHGDTIHRNVFIGANRVTGIIDWGCGLFGDFLYDVAYMSFWWPWYDQWREIDLVEEARRDYAGQSADVAHFDERVAAYQLRTGLDAMIYAAWLGRAPELAWNTRRILSIINAR